MPIFKSLNSLCNIISTYYNKNESLPEIDIISEAHSNKSLELFKHYIDIIPTINDLICNGDGVEKWVNTVNTRRNSYLFKFLTIKYVYPIILILGLSGNFVSLLTMVRIYYHKRLHRRLALSLATL